VAELRDLIQSGIRWVVRTRDSTRTSTRLTDKNPVWDAAVEMTLTERNAQTERDLVHSALFYRSEHEYLEAVVPTIDEWLCAARPVLVSLPGDKLSVLRRALGIIGEELDGDATPNLTVTDITEVGRNPGRILGLIGCFVRQHRNRQVLLIGEPVWPGRTAAEYPACVQHEALVNLALAGHAVTGLCLYDAARLSDTALADARLTHPLIRRAGTQHHNPEYAVDVALRRSNEPLSTSPAAANFTVHELTDLSGARRCAYRYARLLGMCPERIDDLQLIATELATNSLRHTGESCRLAFWHHNGYLICEASDVGPLDDPLAGRRSTQSGLFVVNAVADLVRTHISSRGTKIHAYVRLDRIANEAC
jgi:anti-sigma regulatory factor (Ser/Thr protein kinase)